MIDTQEFIARIRVDARAVENWIDAGWLAPSEDVGGRGFSDVDLARACLIRDLKGELGVNDDGVSIILDLLDQMHGLRWALRELLSAIHTQPGAAGRIAAEIRSVAATGPSETGDTE
jgi:chaperone modulatory protein CbpM